MRITQYIGDSHNARTLIPMNIRTQLTQYIGDTHNARTLILKTDEVTTSALLSTGTSPTTESTNAVKSWEIRSHEESNPGPKVLPVLL
jgi:hypothetical protein